MRSKVWKEKWVRLTPLDKTSGQGITHLACRIGAVDQTPTHVLKELKRQDVPERRWRMHQEVASLERLNHSGVARFADSNSARWNDDEELYLVTEHVPGKTLRQLVGTSPIPIGDALHLALRLLDVLDYCHGKGVVHRDIKPENIIVRDDNPADPVLIDFGLCYDDDVRPDDFATPAWQAIGNRFYALPEYRVSGADKRDAISDVTLVVAIVSYARTGIDPEVPLDDANRAPHKRPVPAQRLRDLPDPQHASMTRIFDVGFNGDKVRRWTSIETLRRELLDASSAHDDSSPKPSFQDQLGALSQQFAETPAHAMSAQVAALGKAFEAIADETNTRLGKALPHFRPELVLFIGGVPNGTRYIRRFIYIYKLDPKLQLDITVYARIERGEFIIMSVRGSSSTEVIRLALFDPQAEDRIRDGLEEYFLERARELVQRQEIGSRSDEQPHA
jgi:serine/threonine protein kinase